MIFGPNIYLGVDAERSLEPTNIYLIFLTKVCNIIHLLSSVCTNINSDYFMVMLAGCKDIIFILHSSKNNPGLIENVYSTVNWSLFSLYSVDKRVIAFL
jgi:hypothetical protein